MKDVFYKFLNKSYHFLYVIIALSLVFFTIYNQSFIKHIYNILKDDDVGILFKVLAPFALFTLSTCIYLLLFSYKYLLKPFFISLFLIGSITLYMSLNYGVIFDTSMIKNVFETNTHEAFSYLSLKLVIYFIGLGVIPSLILYKVKIYYPKFIKSNIQRLLALIFFFILTIAIVITYYQQFSFIGRKNNTLLKEIMPFSYLVSTTKYINEKYLTKPLEYQYQGLDAKEIETTTKRKLTFVILGETARGDHMAYNGYERDTNFYTKNLNLISFKNVLSCATATAQSVPCMFTNLNKENFSNRKASFQDNVFDIMQRAKVNTAWFDNDGGCKGMCDRIKNTVNIAPNSSKTKCNGDSCFDSILIDYAQNFLESIKDTKEDNIAVFHLIGSHGPRYFERYPEKFAKFLPECRRADVENCNLNSLINTYDNTILYTDYILSEFIKLLKTKEDEYVVSLIYISDHGESLGKNGMFLHGTPYSIAPIGQKHVPFMLYLGKDTPQELKIDRACLEKKINEKLTHDNLFHSLLSLMQIDTKEYNKDLDIFTSCKLK